MAKQWRDAQPVTVPDALRGVVGGHRIISESLVRRGITSPDAAQRFLDPAAYTPAPPDDLPDMARAVERVGRAIDAGEMILVWGDFDVDGQTSTALLVSALRALDAQVTYYIPNRFEEGHGVDVDKLRELFQAQPCSVLLTCDTGIAAHDAVDFATSQGVDVVITDHHSLPPTLPDAYAVVNPMRLPGGHPLRELPGVGTAFMLVRSLYLHRGHDEQATAHLLDLVAMGIVADVMVQVDDTRYWLQRGLDRLRQQPRAGLQAMMQRAEINPAYLTEMDIGFSLAPRLNALGRLDHAQPAVTLLTTDNSAEIAEQINELEGLNQKRKYLTRQVYEAAQQQIRDDEALLRYAVLVVSGEDWHTGVVGIVASRLVDDYNRPVIVLAEQGATASGSARSVEGVDIVQAIGSQAALLDSFGGHTMAAGLRLPAEHIFAFRRGISQVVREMRGEAEFIPELTVDAYVGFDEIDLSFAQEIGRLAPFGNGNPPLTLATRNVTVKSRRTMGSRGDHLDLRLVDDAGHEQRVVWWFGDLEALPGGRFDIAYTVRENVFNGKHEALVEWLDARPVDKTEPAESGAQQAAYDVVDHRRHARPQAQLTAIAAASDDVIVWAEGGVSLPVAHADRYHLRDSVTLAVWTVPPAPDVWRAALNTVQPERVVLFGQVPLFDDARALLEQIIGMAKYALREKGGTLTMGDLVRMTGHTEATLHACLRVIPTKTPLRFIRRGDDAYTVEKTAAPVAGADELLQALQQHLRETAAYRRYWLAQNF